MGDVKLMKPLFHGGNFNREGRKMRSVFLKEVTNGTDTFLLWRSDGKADMSYPRAENDKYILYVEVNGYLATLRMTEFNLINDCGYFPAIQNLYGGRKQRDEYFDKLRSAGQTDGVSFSEAFDCENAEIQRYGSDPARQTDYIKAILDKHKAAYLQSKENGGQTFPDFTGALMLNDLPNCVKLRERYGEVLLCKKEERLAEKRRADEELVQSENAKAEQAVQAALGIIKHGGTLQNERIKLYTLTPDDYTVSEYSIVNYLMRRFNTDIPLRTQGWVNDRLAKVNIGNGQCTSISFFRKGRGKASQKFFDCMDELIHAVCQKGG